MQESSCWARAAGPAQVGTAGTAASPAAPVPAEFPWGQTTERSQLLAATATICALCRSLWCLGEGGSITPQIQATWAHPALPQDCTWAGSWQQPRGEGGNGAPVDVGTGESQLGALGSQEYKQDR